MESFFQSIPITHPDRSPQPKEQQQQQEGGGGGGSSSDGGGGGGGGEKTAKNEKKPLNRQNSSWYNMSFLDCGYKNEKSPPLCQTPPSPPSNPPCLPPVYNKSILYN